MRELEARLGIRLLTRTTRSVSMTEAGEHLYESVAPRLEDIQAELAMMGQFRDTPVGTVRINTTGHAADLYVWPRLSSMLPQYPQLKVEVAVDYGLTDIVAQRFDIGIRLGEHLARDMIAVPVSPPQRIAVVATPAYFATHGIPRTPQELVTHNCIGMRLPTHGGLLPWEFDRDGVQYKSRVEGQWIFNGSAPALRAALAGVGLAYLPEDLMHEHLATGRLQRVLEEWCEPYDGYYAYYPSRRQASRALQVVIEALRHPAG
jgi:DNA-binding transcriptional LysR family regulator